MGKNLVIVESPTKARTISRFLGGDFTVESSLGHIRDLPKSKLGIDVDNNFAPQYIIPREKKPLVKKLHEAAKKADLIILAVDEDREGEAIAWHLVQALGLNEGSQLPASDFQQERKDVKEPGAKGRKRKAESREPRAAIERIVFHEITKKAIEEALKNPRDIDMKLVNAQQARRILDRLVGYKLSPFLWKKVYKGLSAGRVQSVAVRLIVEREREIQKFKSQEYWSLEAMLRAQKTTENAAENNAENNFSAILVAIDSKALDKFAISNGEEAEKIVNALEGAEWIVEKVDKKETAKNPLPPFTTSTLQQEAFRRLGFSAKRTMMLAQQLYEGVNLGEGSTGIITYMRTDSVNLSEDALTMAKQCIEKEYGLPYALSSGRRFKTKTKGAQEAHEAIRPTDPLRTPDSIAGALDPAQYKLYNIIWRRFIATQMPAAVFDSTVVDIAATSSSKLPASSHTFRATGQTMKFDGFLRVYPLKFSETTLPALEAEEILDLLKLTPYQHFTEPPPRYTEASLIKTLEKFGIGRPSTYAPTIATIQDRKYVKRNEKKQLEPTEIGFVVNDLLVEHFPSVVDIQFTAHMEEDLDDIAAGRQEWQPIIREFYEPFAERLETKYAEVKKQTTDEETDEVCEKCGKPMVIKMGRFGKFIACSGFPECKNTKKIKEELETIGMKCPKCKEGEIIIRRTRKRRMFYGCSRYPECDFASWNDPRKEEKK